MERNRLRLPFAVVATIVAVGAATVALRPRTGLIEPAPVDAKAYFSHGQIERAYAFRATQRLLGLAAVVVSGGVLVVVALRPPRAARRWLARAEARPLAGAAAVGAGLSLVLVIATLPINAVAHARAVDAGLSTQSFGPWLGDVAKSAAVGGVLSAVAAAVAVAVLRRFPRHPWLPGAAAVVALSAAYLFLAPLVLEPVFNRFTPLPRGELRSEVLSLARRAGVDVGEVYRVDASRRTTGANAYVGGLGRTKRVVLYDTLLDGFPPDQVRSVVAHELGHVRYGDLWHGLLWLAIVAPPAVFLAQVVAESVVGAARPGGRRRSGAQRGAARRERFGGRAPLPGTAAALPALALSVAAVSLAGTLASNYLSRLVEARADAFALRLAGEPAAFIGLERSLAVTNLGEPDPPPLWQALLGTHPTPVERIGFALAYARDRRPGAGR
jgi:STE24 endopeptidase